jgi:hypothetical protein
VQPARRLPLGPPLIPHQHHGADSEQQRTERDDHRGHGPLQRRTPVHPTQIAGELMLVLPDVAQHLVAQRREGQRGELGVPLNTGSAPDHRHDLDDDAAVVGVRAANDVERHPVARAMNLQPVQIGAGRVEGERQLGAAVLGAAGHEVAAQGRVLLVDADRDVVPDPGELLCPAYLRRGLTGHDGPDHGQGGQHRDADRGAGDGRPRQGTAGQPAHQPGAVAGDDGTEHITHGCHIRQVLPGTDRTTGNTADQATGFWAVVFGFGGDERCRSGRGRRTRCSCCCRPRSASVWPAGR